MKGESIIPGNPSAVSGYIPTVEKSSPNNTSITFTSHMKNTKMPGMIILRRSFFL
jgi:hypothetical protein